MAKVKFVGMLVGLLFLMNVLRDYYAVAHQDHFLGIQHSDVGRDHDDHSNCYNPMADVAAHDAEVSPEKNNKELGGRQMVAMKKRNKVDDGHGASSAVASTDDHDHDHNMNAVAYHKKLRYLKHQAFPAASSRAKTLKVAAIEGDSTDDHKLMEATRKIVALMHRDYKGMNKPKRKPPINNHLPVH